MALSLLLFLALTVPKGGGVWARRAASGGESLPGAAPDAFALAVLVVAGAAIVAAWFLSAVRRGTLAG